MTGRFCPPPPQTFTANKAVRAERMLEGGVAEAPTQQMEQAGTMQGGQEDAGRTLTLLMKMTGRGGGGRGGGFQGETAACLCSKTPPTNNPPLLRWLLFLCSRLRLEQLILI